MRDHDWFFEVQMQSNGTTGRSGKERNWSTRVFGTDEGSIKHASKDEEFGHSSLFL